MSNQPSRHTPTRSLNRRGFLKRLGITGSAAAVTAYFPGPQRSANAQQPFQLRAPEPNPKYGGTLRYGMLSAPAHFDVHQSGTVSNIAPQSPMYDTLLRRDPRNAQSIIPDLAHKWEISPDGKVYTFHLRSGVKFHDGADFTADDVKATYSRIIWPPSGVVSPRRPLFATVSEIRVIDPHQIQFRLSEPRPSKFMLGAFASGWNIIVRRKSLEEHGNNLRNVADYPGTGPFRTVSRKDKEVWILERNPSYWNKGLPYLDRIELYHLPPFSPELGAALLAGKLDYARLLDPVSARKVKETKGMVSTEFYQTVIEAVWMNNKRSAVSDPRVRRAMHLALDRHVLVDVVKDVFPLLIGGFTYPFSEVAAPPDEMIKRIGYEKDTKAAIQEARRLMAEAGHPNGIKDLDFLVRGDDAAVKLWAVAIQAMLKEALNIETKLRTVQISQFFEDIGRQTFDLAIGAIVSTLIDPSDYFNAWYEKSGPLNYSQWGNERFQALTKQIDHELDDAKRKALIRQAEAILEQDPPLLPIGYQKILDGGYSYVKGQNPATFLGMYDVVRWDTVWLDK